MRTFYLFKIKNGVRKKVNNTYSLFKALEGIYNLNKSKLPYYYDLFDAMREVFPKQYLDDKIYELYKDRFTYSKVNNVHMINDYFSKEKSKLVVKRNYIWLKSTKSLPTFLKDMQNNTNIFVCDFKTKDYFWLEELVKARNI